MKRLRGAQVGTQCTEGDLQELYERGARLVRFQIAPYPTESEELWRTQVITHSVKLMQFAIKFEGKLKFIVDLHRAPPIQDIEERIEVINEVWELLAEGLSPFKAIIGFGILNEPAMSRAFTRKTMISCIETIREYSNKTIFISFQAGTPDSFLKGQPIAAKNLVYEVHMYSPMRLTHQGVYPEYPTGVIYPHNRLNKRKLRRALAPVREFQLRHKVKIYVGEFSISVHSDEDSRVRYLTDCISLFEKYGWSWTYHAVFESDEWSPLRSSRVLSVLEDGWSKNNLINRLKTYIINFLGGKKED